MTLGKWGTLGLLATAELLAMSLWFSASAVTPSLIEAWQISAGQAAWLTMTVQIGFVVGAVASALFNVADLWQPRFVFAGGAAAGAAANALIPALDATFPLALALRFLTGVALAAVYPVGMKIMATWTREDRGLGLGLLVGALTVGSASPHLIRGLGGIDAWRSVLLTASVLAAVAGVIVLAGGHLGPYRGAQPRFRWSYMSRALTERGLRLANFGYLGHMWELYAMWTWIPLFLTFAYRNAPDGSAIHAVGPERAAAFMTFAVIGVGGLSCVLAGKLADAWGRTTVTTGSMVASGACAATIGLFAENFPGIVTVIALVWGFAVIADSAQFSTAVTELGDPEYAGTLLTTQTSMGFLLTLASIQLVPVLVGLVGWRWAFAALAVGPLLGSWSMLALRRAPEATRLAGGRG